MLAGSIWRLRRLNDAEARLFRSACQPVPEEDQPTQIYVKWCQPDEVSESGTEAPQSKTHKPPDPEWIGRHLLRGSTSNLAQLARYESTLVRRYHISFQYLRQRSAQLQVQNDETNPCPEMGRPTGSDTIERAYEPGEPLAPASSKNPTEQC